MKAVKRELFCGIDIGGTKIATVIADTRGAIAAQAVIPTNPWLGPLQAVERTCSLLKSLLRQHSLEISAIGIGLPGLIDQSAGRILLLPNLAEEWRHYGIAQAFESRIDKPVFLSNDARLAVLGEYSFGTRRRSQDLLFVTVGTGIGGGLILDGKLRLGAFGAAGELGHQTIVQDGALCGCGSRGCLETLVSGPVLTATGKALIEKGLAPILYELVAGNADGVTPAQMAFAAKGGDTAVAEAIQQAAEYLGLGIANAITITAVEEVVVGGGLSSLGSLLLEPVRRVIRERVRMFPSEVIKVSCSALGENCGALGGVVLAAQEYSRTTTIPAQAKSGESR